ncbi:hypothetical protein [Scandinavium goeteborgense]|uniref:hypothetical protein n=1 Tax=Scandinavium goeteborgense TaxID=1851514 RepID=UPI00105E2CA4|nr:hypothetical protein [Scandinavium goeteborgense]
MDVSDGLILGGIAKVNIDDDKALKILLERDDYVYFSLLKQDLTIPIFEEGTGRSSWLEFVWSNNGIVLFPLGYMDESSCEIVAMGHELDISPLL